MFLSCPDLIANQVCILDSIVVAFVVGVALHFTSLVENELFKYPQEW